MELKTRLCSTLVKVFPQQEPDAVPYASDSALKGETFSFQVAYLGDLSRERFDVRIDSPLKKYVRVRRVELIPVPYLSIFTSVNGMNDDILSDRAGLYPDLLTDLTRPIFYLPGMWGALWVTVEIPRNCKAGKYPVGITLFNPDTEGQEFTETFQLEVLNAVLPKQKLIHTEWFHSDCLAVYYKTEMWSEKHWELIENQVRSMAKHGINMLLTPVFTPPLDTAVGGERPTTQLVGVNLKKGVYSFDFTKLDRWIKMAQRCGIEYFEISHLFTQWGAAFCPKIVASVGNREQRIFGWDVKATSDSYVEFLDVFLPQLVAFLNERKLKNKTYFHCSDEPHVDHLELYSAAVSILRKHVKGFHICDALSNVDFYKSGLVSTPIPAEDHIEPFVEAGVKPLWTYYCCGQLDKVSNRFLYMPSSRNRIMGTLLYRYDIAGFLQWGFNFYYSRHSLYPIDPFRLTDSDSAFPPGDPFMVYPGEDGTPLDSIHYEVFAQGLQDLRALRLLETKLSRKEIEAMLDRKSPEKRMSMKEYPRGEKAVLALRKMINDKIKKLFV